MYRCNKCRESWDAGIILHYFGVCINHETFIKLSQPCFKLHNLEKIFSDILVWNFVALGRDARLKRDRDLHGRVEERQALRLRDQWEIWRPQVRGRVVQQPVSRLCLYEPRKYITNQKSLLRIQKVWPTASSDPRLWPLAKAFTPLGKKHLFFFKVFSCFTQFLVFLSYPGKIMRNYKRKRKIN